MNFCEAVKATGEKPFGTLAPMSGPDRARMRQRLAASYQPMLRALLFPFAIYFVAVTVAYLFIEEPIGQVLLGGSSLIIAAISFAMGIDTTRRQYSYREVETCGLALMTMVLLNTMSHQLLHLEPAKLFFFTLIILMTAVVGISARLVAIASAAGSAAMLYLAGRVGADLQLQYVFIAVATSFVAILMSSLTRRTIMREICASMTADELRRNAEHLAGNDALTDLPNRRSFFRVLDQKFGLRRSVEPGFALAIINLDGFKTINETYGHAVGDKLLVEAAARLREICRDDRFMARLSGDEFAIIFDNPGDASKLTQIGEAIRTEIGRPYAILGIQVTIGASVVFVPDQINIFTSSEMIERADFAMSRAKQQDGGVIVYSSALEEDRRRGAAIEHNLRHCDRDAEMSVVFQPQIDLVTGRTIGFESLGRWTNRELGSIRPDIFIRAAERIGVIQDLSALFLTKALAAAKDWPDGVKLSFNLSIRDIETPAAVENIRRIVAESGFPPERVEFEVTETLIMSDFEQARRSLKVLHEIGARVGLDDFGVGYANFGHIDQLNINTIKIDRSFVARLCESGNSGKIVRTMIEMCANLGVGCVVEGVETAEELAALRHMGARYVQGFYFAKPMPPEEVAVHFARELSDRVGEASQEAVRAV